MSPNKRQKQDPPVSILFAEPDKRFQMMPIREKGCFDQYKLALSSFWTMEEIDMATDRIQWETDLNDNERHFISVILAFFAPSDLVVNENLCSRFLQEVTLPEARLFLQFQAAMENIHSETYNMFIQTLIRDEGDRNKLFDSVANFPYVKQKIQWALKYANANSSFAERVIAFLCVEGIFFSASFCAIFWLKKRNLMPGLAFSNELISRDEGLHVDFGVHMYKLLTPHEQIRSEEIQAIVRDAVEIECEFVTSALPVSLIGMNEASMRQYVKFCADRLLVQLGGPKVYNVANPYDFMEMISLQGKTNFFEKRVSEYAKAGIATKQDENVFTLDADF
jgi:ribonucleotide reductase beta subunit family protein with ferritin-like domain